MANFYVLINDSYTSTGFGSESSPLNWNQLLTVIGTHNYTPVNNDYYFISGTRNLTADQTISIKARGSNIVILQGWLQSTWKILNPSNDINLQTSSAPIRIYDAMIQADTLNIIGPNYLAATGNIEFQNTYLKSNLMNALYKNLFTIYASTCKTNKLDKKYESKIWK
jgi:hypothetical protein